MLTNNNCIYALIKVSGIYEILIYVMIKKAIKLCKSLNEYYYKLI